MSTTPLPVPLQADPLIGQNVGGYIVEQVLGEGGMGLVYRARHPLLNRHFAVKVLRPEIAADSTSSGNFVREAQTLSSLKHPAIIDIVGFGPLNDGRQYMVMEFLEGRTLEAEMLETGRMYTDRALKLADEILDALTAAHSVNVIHRDLKPSNVFICKGAGGREFVKLLDFGLAKQQPVALAGSAPIGASVLAGTPEYVAPEQATGQAASKGSDLYSFGIMLFEMVTGQLPFKSDEKLSGDERVRGLLRMHASATPPRIEQVATDIMYPEGLSEIVGDLLRKNIEERPLSADTVRKRLQRCYRLLLQEQTATRANPLYSLTPKLPMNAVRASPLGRDPSAPRHAVTEKVLRTGQTERAIAAGLGHTGQPGRRRSIIAAVIVVAILLWWFGTSSTPKPTEPMAPVLEPVATKPVAVVEPAPVAPVAPEAPKEDEVVALPPPGPGVKPVPVPVKKKYVEQARTWIQLAPGCEPTAGWRQDATATMRELGEEAAKKSPARYAEYAKREPVVSGSIAAAQDSATCGKASQQIGELTDLVMRP